MNEEQKKRIAVFRFGVISDFVNRAQLERGEKQRLVEQKCAQRWQIPFSGRTRLTPSTILNWIGRYEQSAGRLESLYPQDRNDQGISRVIDTGTAQALVRLRREMPQRPVAGLIEEMVRRELASPGVRLKPTTVYRFLREQGLMDLRKPAPVDRRRFESELPNDLWQSDIMHGPAVLVEGKRRKSYLIAFLDDHSRLIPHAEFYLSERLDNYLDALRKALRKRGLPRKLYVDNGSALRARLLEEITASLGIALIHSRPYTPQGRGKIERLFRSLRSQFLSACTQETLQTPEVLAVADRFDYALRLGAMALVTGEVGSGKSTALRWATSRLHPSEYIVLWVTASAGSILEIYRQLCSELEVHTGSSSRAVMIRIIRRQIAEIVTARKKNRY
jgi:putative transposase